MHYFIYNDTKNVLTENSLHDFSLIQIIIFFKKNMPRIIGLPNDLGKSIYKETVGKNSKQPVYKI